MRSIPRNRAAILLILLAGTALRLFRLGAESLWYDETVSTYLAGSPLPELIRHTALDIHPPGYYLLLRGWLLLTGFGDGRAQPNGYGLEWSAAFLSLFFGVLLIALAYALARRLVGQSAALVAAALVALSPYNAWYSQEVRMYTVGAVLGVVAVWGLAAGLGEWRRGSKRTSGWTRVVAPLPLYTLSAALGLYTLYYFAFLLIPLNVWGLWRAVRTSRVKAWLVANLGVVILYAPWLPTAWRQATQPPVPPWRTVPDILAAVGETWQALVLGQSARGWLWPVLLLAAIFYVLGVGVIARRRGSLAVLLVAATFGPLALILGISLVTPLYHVRYMFTYSPAFYIVLAAGLAASAPSRSGRPRRSFGVVFALVWVAAAGLALRDFWFAPAFRPDDHRAAVNDLRAQWHPGDVVLVNAGWAYTVLETYWEGALGGRYRITGALPEARSDDALVMVTTGHVNGDAGLGWGDPRSDFFAMPETVAVGQVADLFHRFPRVWHYRVYDTVNDPEGLVRQLLAEGGRLVADRTYAGEAYLRLEAYASPQVTWPEGTPVVRYGGLELTWRPASLSAAAGERVYTEGWWRVAQPVTTLLATSLRLVGENGETWAQPPDENPFSPMHTSVEWLPGEVMRQPLALTVPPGTVPGRYNLVLVPYGSVNGAPLQVTESTGVERMDGSGPIMGQVTVQRGVAPPPRPAVATFGPLALISAESAATTLSPGDGLSVDLLWQARGAPGEPYVVVVQLLDGQGAVAASAEMQPVLGSYPTSEWIAGELVRDRQYLTLPGTVPGGEYSLIVGLYRGADGRRMTTREGLLRESDHWNVKTITVR